MSEQELKEQFSDNPNAADFRPQDLQLALVPFVDMLNHQGGYVSASYSCVESFVFICSMTVLGNDNAQKMCIFHKTLCGVCVCVCYAQPISSEL